VFRMRDGTKNWRLGNRRGRGRVVVMVVVVVGLVRGVEEVVEAAKRRSPDATTKSRCANYAPSSRTRPPNEQAVAVAVAAAMLQTIS